MSKKIIVLGGGTAGWMSAMLMAKQLIPLGCTVTLVESPDVGIIGVGEGSTPALKNFFDEMGISENEWMPECNATYKCGITFAGWSGKPGFTQYFHPFASQLDQHTLPAFMRQAQLRVGGVNVHAHPDRYFVSAKLAELDLAPKANWNFPFDVVYGYHFDSGLLGQFLKRKSIECGVDFIQAHIKHITQLENGDIATLVTDKGKVFSADYFVDCSGFSGLLIQKTLQTPFRSFKHNLFNDAAVAMPTEITEKIPSQTLSTALKNGWAWKIPLTERFGNGYVYASDFCSADEAEMELRMHLGLVDADIPVRHLKMKVGQVEKHWNKNCVAVGLSQGFIEPLEATALYLVQQTIGVFVEYLVKGNFTAQFRDAFNARIVQNFEGTRDYIVTHYKTSSRRDTEYWRANTANPTDVSDVMKQLYARWMAGDDLVQAVHELHVDKYYASPSWYCIFAGMGIFPNPSRLREPNVKEITDLKSLDDFIQRCASNYRDHREYLASTQIAV